MKEVAKGIVYDDGVFVIRHYGCCGRFAYLVGDSVTRRIIKLPFCSYEDAIIFILSK